MPHSGTRTLVKHLGIEAKDHGLYGSYWHWGQPHPMNDAEILVHIPIRHPMDVARSWGQRPKTGDVVSALMKSYRVMFEFLDRHEDRAMLYKMEDLPRLAGLDGPKDAPEKSLLITELQGAVTEHVVVPRMEFFKQFYGDEICP